MKLIRMRLALVLVPVFLLTGQSPGFDAETTTRKFHALLDDAWQFELRDQPLFATRAEDNRYNDQLPNVSISDYRQRLRTRRGQLESLKRLHRDELSRKDRLNYDIFAQTLDNEIAEMEFQMYMIPITNRSGFHVEFPDLPTQVPLDSVEDFENYVARLRGFREYAAQHIEAMRAGIGIGLVLPAVVLEGYEGTLQPHIVEDPTESLLYAPLQTMGERIEEKDQQRLRQAAIEAISTSVVPGYREFYEFMKSEYVPHARGSIGISAIARGREYYRHRVKRFTTLDLAPEAVHEIGQNEVRRIRAEMETVIERTGFEGDFSDFVEFLRTAPQFYADTPTALLKEVSLVLKKMDGQLPRLFKTLPRTPYGIREIPAYLAPKTTTAYYMQPAGDGSRAGFYYVNTYNLKSRPFYEIEALSLHEAVPGHHLQIALQQEIQDLPDFRRFADFTVFIEGWALYAERLGLEVGFYKDPYSDFGRLSYEMWRACRLVVDTGMHYLGWTRQQAIMFMSDNTSLSLHNIEAEVDRYIAWPGQALAYKIGELKIRQLRAEAEKKLGERFDIREFHDLVLGSGAVPLTVLEENVAQYIDQTNGPASLKNSP